MSIFYRSMAVINLLLCLSCNDKNNHSNESDPAFQQGAVKELTEKIKRDPDNARLYFERGTLLHRIAEDSLALEDFKKAVKYDSTKAEYFSAVGDLLFDHKDISGSVPWLEKAIALNPDDPKAHMKIARMMVYLKEYPKAFREINTVLRQDAMNAEGYFLKGIIYKDMKDTIKAISSFQTSLQVLPDYYDAMIQLGLLYTAKGDELGLKYLDNAFRKDTTDVFPLYAKAMYYQEQGKYEEAKKEYSKAIRYDGDYTDAYFNIGWILMQQDSLEKAWRHFDLVTKMDITNAAAYYNRGLCSELMNKRKDALDDYQQALVFDKDYQEAAEAVKRLSR